LNHDSGSKRTLEIDLTHCEATAAVLAAVAVLACIV